MPGTDDVTCLKYREPPKNMKSLFISHPRQRTHQSDGDRKQMLASEGDTCLIKETASCWNTKCHKKSMPLDTVNNMELSGRTAGTQAGRRQMEPSKEQGTGTWKEGQRTYKQKEKAKEDPACSGDNKNYRNEPQMMPETSNLSLGPHLTIPTTLTIYEQYQLCVDQLHQLRVRKSQHEKLKFFLESPSKESKTSQDMAALAEAPTLPIPGFELDPPTTETLKTLNRRDTAATITSEWSVTVLNNNQDGSKHNRSKAAIPGQEVTKQCDSLIVKQSQTPICTESRHSGQRNTKLDLDIDKYGLIKGTGGGMTSKDKMISTPKEPLRTIPAVEDSAALTHCNSGQY